MKRTIGIAFLVLGLGFATNAAAQDEGFTATTTDVGPVIGFGGLHGAGASVGLRVEKGFKEFANGAILGIQVSADFYNYDFPFSDDGVSVIPVAVMVNYHFKFPNQPKLDVFAGAGLGFQRVSFDCGPFINCDVADSDVFGVGHGGIRYYWRPKIAAYADVVGNGAGALNIGVMFKLGE